MSTLRHTNPSSLAVHIHNLLEPDSPTRAKGRREQATPQRKFAKLPFEGLTIEQDLSNLMQQSNYKGCVLEKRKSVWVILKHPVKNKAEADSVLRKAYESLSKSIIVL